MDICNFNILETHNSLKKKEFSALELCRVYLDKIKKNNKKIFAFLSVNEDFAISKAKQADNIISKEKDFPVLTGIPCAIKDNILVEGVSCTAGSKTLKDYIAPYSATVIEKLNSQNAVILGKTNLDEFAMGSSTENSAFGPTKNPNDLNRVPGGSSGGSAAAVAGNLAVFALGSDTGGSVRLPACFCGVVGLKPTYGAVSRYGLIAFASSLDQIGPITKTVEDAKIVFDAIKGKDLLDSTSVKTEFQNSKLEIKNLSIGVPKEYFAEGMDSKVEKAIKEVIKKYEEMGAKIQEISLPNVKYALSCYYIIACSEASANMARYDGIRFGYSLNDYFKNRSQGFGDEVKRRIMLGTYSLSSGYYDKYYSKAQKMREQIINDFKNAFKKVDVIFAPVSPFLPFKIGEKIKDPVSMYLVDIYSVSVNLAKLPSISLPCGASEGSEGRRRDEVSSPCGKINKLPVGFQIIGKPFEENKIFEIAKLL